MKRIYLLMFMCISYGLNAQLIEDGLRLTQTENGVSPRSNALGMSFYGVSDDGAALYFNPAGMQLVPATEIQAGFAVKYLNSDIRYLNGEFTNDRSAQYLSNFTFVAPFESDGNKFTIGLGYFKDRDFYDLNNFSIFNTQNSNVNALSVNNLMRNNTRLYDERGNTPVNDSLQQNYSLLQDGGNARFTGGFSFSLGEKASIGASISGFNSNYNSTEKLDEFDSRNIYEYYDEANMTDVDFSSIYFTELISQEISGLTGSIGFMVTPTEKSRVFVSVDFPSVYTIMEDWNREYIVDYDDNFFNEITEGGSVEYSVITPAKFNLGVSYNIFGLTLTGGMSYMDVTNLKFESNDEFINQINIQIPERLASAKIDWGVGAEYQFPMYPVFLRASYSSHNTPYREGYINLTTMETLAVGAGFLVGKHVMLDVSLSNRDFEERTLLYSDQSFNNVRDITNVIVGFSYRF